MLTPAEADKLIGERVACLPIESLPLAQCAGAVLRENVYAERDAPPFHRVAMDGIALQSDAVRGGTRRYKLQATQAAGDPALTLTSKAACIEVMTGAVLPEECDAVVPVEQITSRDGEVELSTGVDVESVPRL
jgi:molybdopterin molybdotransferase